MATGSYTFYNLYVITSFMEHGDLFTRNESVEMILHQLITVDWDTKLFADMDKHALYVFSFGIGTHFYVFEFLLNLISFICFSHD